MSYLELYIEGSTTQDPIASGYNYMYLLPGLIDYHTAASASEADILVWKQDYNRWLELVNSNKILLETDDTLTKKEADRIKSNIKHWAEVMHDLLNKIGRYSTPEKQEGFHIE